MKLLGRIFAKGLLAVLPLGVTVGVLVWMGSMLETAAGKILTLAMGSEYYREGMGLVAGLVLIFLLGLLLNAWIVRKLWSTAESLVDRLPFVKILYGSVRDLMKYFGADGKKDFGQTVLVTVADGTKVLGIVTRKSMEGFHEAFGGSQVLAVYLPMSYQVGGYTVLVPRSAVEFVDMDFEEAMRFAVTAGVSSEKT
ncbi:MAG: DUF502 domain-containing protein [Planctomycetota bacterium]